MYEPENVPDTLWFSSSFGQSVGTIHVLRSLLCTQPSTLHPLVVLLRKSVMPESPCHHIAYLHMYSLGMFGSCLLKMTFRPISLHAVTTRQAALYLCKR